MFRPFCIVVPPSESVDDVTRDRRHSAAGGSTSGGEYLVAARIGVNAPEAGTHSRDVINEPGELIIGQMYADPPQRRAASSAFTLDRSGSMQHTGRQKCGRKKRRRGAGRAHR